MRAVAPGPALKAALAETDADDPARPLHILALGKAAGPMAAAAVEFLTARGREPEGGIIVAPDAPPPPHRALTVVAGDHPEPGPRSLAAATALGEAAARVRDDDRAWVLLSGGATSLTAAPIEGVPPEDLTRLYALLLGSGLDIGAMNRIRKRFSRWAAGRLAKALAPAEVRVYVISDVIGDQLAAIGSGPCVPDETNAAEVRALLTSAALWDRIPESIRVALGRAERDHTLATPKPGDPVFARVEHRVVASNRLALEAAAARAETVGLTSTVMQEPLRGEASDVGRSVALTLLNNSQSRATQPAGEPPTCVIWGGETTVNLGDGPVGAGGRCQELALAAAQILSERAPEGAVIALLAAGTDGRDGPTDAAGAVVDAGTWDAIREAGRDPARDLARHDAYPALDAAGALLRTGLTGTNVMDVVIGLRGT